MYLCEHSISHYVGGSVEFLGHMVCAFLFSWILPIAIHWQRNNAHPYQHFVMGLVPPHPQQFQCAHIFLFFDLYQDDS